MKTRYKIVVIVSCVFAGWILFPNITGAICYFSDSVGDGGIGMTEPNICSIVGINFFGHPLGTNLFNENVRDKISESSKFAQRENRVIIDGEMARQICAVTGGQCPQFYVGNLQEDGSVMVGMTFWKQGKETFYEFFVKNGTLRYEVKENED